MAKLKGPLFSLGASQKLGDALVYFPWKGLNVVREYVIPANPNTTKQQTQRGYLRAAVAMIHLCQGLAANSFAAADAQSYALLGSLEPTPRTWFNTICRQWLKQKVAGLLPILMTGGSCTPGSLKLTLKMAWRTESSDISNGNIYWGTSKSALINILACTAGALLAGKDIPGLTKGVKYYCQFRPTLPVGFIGSDSGIWYGTPTA